MGEYWRCRNLPNVLLVAYEHLKTDLNAHIPLLANFMGLSEPDDAVHEKVAELSSYAWMPQNQNLFDDHHVEVRMATKKGKGKGKVATKVGLQLGSAYNTKVSEGTREHL